MDWSNPRTEFFLRSQLGPRSEPFAETTGNISCRMGLGANGLEAVTDWALGRPTAGRLFHSHETIAFTSMNVRMIYRGSDGERTKRLYDALCSNGPLGLVAKELFRAQKASSRAKVYHGGNFKGRFKDQAYSKKQWSMNNLCELLSNHAAALGIVWGWGEDLKRTYHNKVLYVDIPTGQVSFHADERGVGPDYPGYWDRQGNSEQRILIFCQAIVDGRADSLRVVTSMGGEDADELL